MFLPSSLYKLTRLSLAAVCLMAPALAGPHVAVAPADKSLRQYSAKIASCMPSDVKLDEVAVYEHRRNISVAEKLKSLSARCSKDRLTGRNHKEIRFFRRACYGHPPPNYLELQAEQSRQLEELRSKYIVVVIGCDPRIP